MKLKNHKKTMAGSTILYVLLALAIIGLLISWISIKSRDEGIVDRDAKIAELEDMNSSMQADNANLTQQLATSEQNNADLTTIHLDTKKQLSFSRASNQRAKQVATARSNLIETAAALKTQVADLSTQNEQIEPLKKNLSFANALNQRLEHIADARDNLMVQVKATNDANAVLSEQAALVPGLKSRLSHANANNKRLQHVAEARDNLMVQVKEATATNKALSEQVELIPGLKSRLSYANAANARLEHIRDARENLMVKNQLLQVEVEKIPGLEQTINDTNAENTRLHVIEDASKTFIATVSGSISGSTVRASESKPAVNLVVDNTTADDSDTATAFASAKAAMAVTEKRRSWARAEAQRAQQRLQDIPRLVQQIDVLTELNSTLGQENTAIPVLKKDLSIARAQNQRLKSVAQARQNLMREIAEKNEINSVLKSAAAEVPVLKKELSYARANIDRLENVSKARDNLMIQFNDAKSTLAVQKETLAVASRSVAEVELQRSYAAARAQRAEAKAANVPRLAATIGELTEENQQFAVQLAGLPKLKKDLSMARAEVQRSVAVKRARDNLMGQLKAVSMRVSATAAEPTTEVAPSAMASTDLLQQKLDELKSEIQENIVFASGSAWVNFKARKTLNKVARLMVDYPDHSLVVSGHTDLVGTATVNKVLSQTRAHRVVQYLVSKNISEDRLSAVGYGAERPLDKTQAENAKLNNRRVEFTVEN